MQTVVRMITSDYTFVLHKGLSYKKAITAPGAFCAERKKFNHSQSDSSFSFFLAACH